MQQLDVINYLKKKNFTTSQATQLLDTKFNGLDSKTPNEFAQEKSYDEVLIALERVFGK